MSTFFNDTMTGLLQAVAIENGEIPVTEIEGMPAKTYRSSENLPVNLENTNEIKTPPQTSQRVAVIS